MKEFQQKVENIIKGLNELLIIIEKEEQGSEEAKQQNEQLVETLEEERNYLIEEEQNYLKHTQILEDEWKELKESAKRHELRKEQETIREIIKQLNQYMQKNEEEIR